MKLKNDFVLRQVAQTWVVLPLGDTAFDFTSMIKLNDSGALLWHALEKNADKAYLIATLTAEYDVSEAQAAEDVDAFLEILLNAGCLEQE